MSLDQASVTREECEAIIAAPSFLLCTKCHWFGLDYKEHEQRGCPYALIESAHKEKRLARACIALLDSHEQIIQQLRRDLEHREREYRILSDELEQLQADKERGFLAFCAAQAEWSQATFGTDAERGPTGALKHLAKEVQEALANIDDEMEYVDCFFLVLDASRRKGMTATRLLERAFEKLEINKLRKWNRPTSDDPVEHDRSEDAARSVQLAKEGT